MSSNAWVLTSTLPQEYRSATILSPSLIPTTSYESSYAAFYTMIISLISLSGGTLSNEKLDRYLRRLNADVNMLSDKTEVTLQKMQKQGYLTKVVERSGDEQTIDWMVGPRGRVEVGNKGVRELVLEMYGENAPDDLNTRIKSSLGIRDEEGDEDVEDAAVEQPVEDAENQGRRSVRSRRRPVEGEDD
jgi:hypothetical protein